MRSQRQIEQYTRRAINAGTAVMEFSTSTLKRPIQTAAVRYATSTKWPESVCMTALIACAKPAPKNISASSEAPATILHLTQAERAMANRERIAIQMREPTTRLPAIQKLFQVQVVPAKLA